MRLVAECFETIASDYPLDFLHFVAHMPLDPEPEVLGHIDMSTQPSPSPDIHLDLNPSPSLGARRHRRLRRDAREDAAVRLVAPLPKDMWRAKLAQYSRSFHDEPDQEQALAPPSASASQRD